MYGLVLCTLRNPWALVRVALGMKEQRAHSGVGRRQFVGTLGAGLVAAGVGCAAETTTDASAEALAPERAGLEPMGAPLLPTGQPMHLLILGGTGFLGPHFVRAATARGHMVTLFNRGKTNPHLFPELEKLRGDRRGDLSALHGRSFDGVIDTSGYMPAHVAASAKLLKDSKQYLFVSSVSAYADQSRPMDEQADLAELEDPDTEEVMKYYGPLKAACERAAQAEMPAATTVIRPGLIVGPGDPTDRFTYWPVRVARGGEVLAPGRPGDPVQYVDGRDLADFMLRCMEQRLTKTYNAAGPLEATTIGSLLGSCKTVSGSDATFTWADTEFLAEQQIAPWMGMPVWVPPGSEVAGLVRVDASRAAADGFATRPTEETVRDTLDWWATLPDERTGKLRAGITGEREQAALAVLRKSAVAGGGGKAAIQ